MQIISWEEFTKVELRVGTILSAEEFKGARVPAYILQIDFGPDIGVKRSSAQITKLYQASQLIGKQIIGVVNFPHKQIGSVKSECLVTGFYREDGVVLAVPDLPVPNGSKIG